MRFYKLLLVLPMLCVPMLANAANYIKYTAGGNFSGIATCIYHTSDDKLQKTSDGKEYYDKTVWNTGDCTDDTHDPKAKKATCTKMDAAKDAGWTTTKGDAEYVQESNGIYYKIPALEGGKWLYRCVVKECESADYEVKNGYCQKKKPAAPATGDKGGESAEGGENADGGSATIPADLKEAIAKLDTVMVGGDKSVWKDKEGNFNTARLVSDSIAGVVLGTAGGLITSSVVKKNQLKKGFEDIKCTIGGQEVAGYGDEIKVGVK